jgi:hypothetical protein
MPLEPAVAEDILVLLDKYPDLTVVQRAILRSAATYLVQDEMDRSIAHGDSDKSGIFDPRLKMNFDEYDLVPGRVELIDGIVRPKDWETPNRLAAAGREKREMEQGIQALIASGVPEKEAYGEYFRRLHFTRDFI